MSFTDAYMGIARDFQTNEEDTRQALILAIDHARHALIHARHNKPARGDFSGRDVEAGADLLRGWLTDAQAGAFLAVDLDDEREIGSHLLHRCPAVTWAVLVMAARQRKAQAQEGAK